jgi:hypothetical protein
MDREWKTDLRIQNQAIASLPPATIGETGWDVLLALRADDRHELGLDKLSSLVSVPGLVLAQWLDWLEERELVVGLKHESTQQFLAVITRTGVVLVDNYLSATIGLQSRNH